jgi:hypothetical protein
LLVLDPSVLSHLSPEELEEMEALAAEQVGTTSPFVDSWGFLKHAVWTRDEASRRIRPFADNDDWPDERFEYLRYLHEERQHHRVRAYEKSRRMLITWWLIAEYLYDLMTVPHDLSAVASDKLEKSAYLLGPERMQFIYDHIPPVRDNTLLTLKAQHIDVGPFLEQIWPNRPVVNFTGKRGAKGWESAHCVATDSRCMAVAAGASQMQQYTFSKVLLDEFPRWQWQEDCWRNIQPTLQGGGEADIVCTAELGSFAYDLLYDLEF